MNTKVRHWTVVAAVVVAVLATAAATMKLLRDREAVRPVGVAGRKLGPEAQKPITQLISKLSESHPCRMVGGRRINLSRLNLSINSIK